jgi:predicted glycoside hydrolase/deacetylase ChbG (UPF0249 family)
MKIIINADDLGRNAETNRRIVELAQSGHITSVSLIANAPAIGEAVGELAKCPKLSKGVHLNLTEFSPLTSLDKLGPLRECVNKQGLFRGEEFLRSIRITSALSEAIFAELVGQVESLLARGIHVSHFDSHNHIHTIPSLFLVIKRLQHHFGIRKVRTTWNIFSRQKKQGWRCRFRKQMWHLALRHYYRTVTTDGFSSLADFVEVASSRVLALNSVEVMVHPGHADYAEETSLLHTNWQERVLSPMELISYDELQ